MADGAILAAVGAICLVKASANAMHMHWWTGQVELLDSYGDRVTQDVPWVIQAVDVSTDGHNALAGDVRYGERS